MTPATRDSIRPAEAIAGFLAVCGTFLGLLELFYRPPRTAEEARLAYQTPNAEFDDLERHCVRLPKRRPRE